MMKEEARSERIEGRAGKNQESGRITALGEEILGPGLAALTIRHGDIRRKLACITMQTLLLLRLSM